MRHLVLAGLLVSAFSCSRMELKRDQKALWWGLVVADEKRCNPYSRRDYPYSHIRDLEKKIIERNLMGRHYTAPTRGRFSVLSMTVR